MVEQQNPGESQASIGVTFRCEYGHLISKNPYGSSDDDGSYTAPSGLAPRKG